MGIFLFRHIRRVQPEGVSDRVGQLGKPMGNAVKDDFIGLLHVFPRQVHQAQRAEDPLQRAAFLQAGDGMEAGVEAEPLADEGLQAAAGLRPFLQDRDMPARPGQDRAREEAAEARAYDDGIRHSG